MNQRVLPVLVAVASVLVLAPAASAKKAKKPTGPVCVTDAKGDKATDEVPTVCTFAKQLKPNQLVGPAVLSHFEGKSITVLSADGQRVKVKSLTAAGPFYLPRGWSVTAKGPGLYAHYLPENVKAPPAAPPAEKSDEAKKADESKPEAKADAQKDTKPAAEAEAKPEAKKDAKRDKPVKKRGARKPPAKKKAP